VLLQLPPDLREGEWGKYSGYHGPFGIKRFCLLVKMQARLE
jgi:hypothetical protein